MKHQYQYSMYKKVFVDGDARMYLFDIPKYESYLEEKGYSAAEVCKKVELIVPDEKQKSRQIRRVTQHIYGDVTDAGKPVSVGIGTIKLLGKVLKGNEFYFLKEVTAEYIARAMEEISLDGVLDIANIYRQLYLLLADYVKSSAYNRIPGADEEDAWDYYGDRVDEIKKEIQVQLILKPDVQKRLLRLTDEVLYFIRSYSIPGISERWQAIHKPLAYYSVEYEIFKNQPEIYRRLADGEISRVKLKKKITMLDLIEREAYFAKLKKKNESRNLKKTEEDWFTEELLNALAAVFKHDFPELYEEDTENE